MAWPRSARTRPRLRPSLRVGPPRSRGVRHRGAAVRADGRGRLGRVSAVLQVRRKGRCDRPPVKPIERRLAPGFSELQAFLGTRREILQRLRQKRRVAVLERLYPLRLSGRFRRPRLRRSGRSARRLPSPRRVSTAAARGQRELERDQGDVGGRQQRGHLARGNGFQEPKVPAVRGNGSFPPGPSAALLRARTRDRSGPRPPWPPRRIWSRPWARPGGWCRWPGQCPRPSASGPPSSVLISSDWNPARSSKHRLRWTDGRSGHAGTGARYPLACRASGSRPARHSGSRILPGPMRAATPSLPGSLRGAVRSATGPRR